LAKKIKQKDYENLSFDNIKRVIDLLNPEDGKPITKKEACSLLNISYNTARLAKIIEDYNEKQSYIADRRAKNRGKPASKEEIVEAVTEYLRGENISNISKQLFRSTGFVKSLINAIGVPQRPSGVEESKGIDLLPEPCVAEEFSPGEIVWSAKYHTTAIIKNELTPEYQAASKGLKPVNYENKYGCKCYRIHVMEKVENESQYFPSVVSGGYSAYAPAYDLGKLSHLENFGVKLDKI